MRRKIDALNLFLGVREKNDNLLPVESLKIHLEHYRHLLHGHTELDVFSFVYR